LLNKRAADIDGWVTHRFVPENMQEAFEMVKSYKDGVIKAIIEF
jgi:threonine dehydrogenase-like Zn-dependent dehydrogenase